MTWLIMLVPLGWLAWKAWAYFRTCRSPQERALAVRGMMALGMIGFLVLVGFVFVPMPFKVLFAIPAFLVSGSVAKALRDARNRLKEEPARGVDIDKLKRVN
jgi:hypothetical protein